MDKLIDGFLFFITVFEMLQHLITNADGARYNNFHAKQPVGWTLSQDDAFECEYANYLPAKIGSSYFNKWQGSGNLTNRSISQQLTGLPSGTYRIAVRTSASTIHQGAWLFANSDKADMTQLTDNTVRLTTNVTDGMLTLGVRLENYTSNDCKFDHFTLEYLGNTMATMSIGAAHYGTFAAPFEVTLPAGVTAYTVDGVTGNTLTLTELTTVIPANTPVVTYCENSVDESFTGMPISGSPRHGWLHGVYHQTVVPADAYVLQNLDGKTGFYRVAEGLQPTLKANRCYLSESEPSAVRAYFFDKDNATGIQTLNALLNAGTRIYGTDGQQRNRLEKGVNIVNNKKIFIK